ncbi:MAG: lactonase family protein [Polyangiaceae bacterium]
MGHVEARRGLGLSFFGAVFGASAALLSWESVGCGHHAATSDDAGTTVDARPREDAPAKRDAGDDAAVDAGPPKAVYLTTNQPMANAILAYPRASDGSLGAPASYATGGKGSGQLYDNSQGSLVYDASLGVMLAVNTGDGSFSVLSLEDGGELTLVANVPSGGANPTSITLYQDLVYVLNDGSTMGAADPGNITGFRLMNGTLSPIEGSTQPLSKPSGTEGAQIQFTPDGKVLVVTERATNVIDTYLVDSSGVAAPPKSQPSAGLTPFGFAFGPGGQLVVSEANNGATGVSTMSSYSLGDDGTLVPISSAVATNQTDDCWVVFNGPFAYGTNTKPSFNVTGMRLSPAGVLTRLEDSGVTGVTGQGPEDEAISDDAKFLYTLDTLDGTISIFALEATGALTKLPSYFGIPKGSAGLVAR